MIPSWIGVVTAVVITAIIIILFVAYGLFRAREQREYLERIKSARQRQPRASLQQPANPMGAQPPARQKPDVWGAQPKQPAANAWGAQPAAPQPGAWAAQPPARQKPDVWGAQPKQPAANAWGAQFPAPQPVAWGDQPPAPQPVAWSDQPSAPQPVAWGDQPSAPQPVAWGDQPSAQPAQQQPAEWGALRASQQENTQAQQKKENTSSFLQGGSPSLTKPTIHIFTSHSREDDEFGTQLVQDLRQALGKNSTIWYDTKGGLNAGDRWFQRIEEEIVAHDKFLIILSPNSMNSEWVRKEYYIALNEKKHIIPILYQDCSIWPYLKTIHYISFLPPKSYETAFNELLTALRLSPNTQAKKPRQ